MEQAHTSDTLDIDFLKPQPNFILPKQALSTLYSCQQEHNLLQGIMAMTNFDKPTTLYQLLEQMENQHKKVLSKKGQLSQQQQIPSKKSQHLQSSQQCIRIYSQKQNRNTYCQNDVKNIYQQHNYHTHILPQLAYLYTQNKKQQGETQRKHQVKSLQYLGINLVENSDKLLGSLQIQIEENYINKNGNRSIENKNNNKFFVSQKPNFTQQLSIVTKSVNSVQTLINKISQFRQHSNKIRQKIKQKKFNIDKLHVIKENKKQYLQHLMNVQNIMCNKISVLSTVNIENKSDQNITSTNIDSNKQHQEKLRRVQQLIMKYQYTPYVFLNKTLYNKLYDIISYRIENKLQVRLMNLSGNKLLQLIEIYLPKLILRRSNQSQKQQQMTLTKLTRNLLQIVIYLKPDSYQCIDTKSSTYLNSQFEDLLQQFYITSSLTQLTSHIQLNEFIKVGSMMQYSPTTRKIYASLKYVWLSLYKLGLKHMLSVFRPILAHQQQEIIFQESQSQSLQVSQSKKQSNLKTTIKTVTLSNNNNNINLNQRYGKIGHTLQSITQIFVTFQPKYNWVYEYIVAKNVYLRKYPINGQMKSLSLYLVDSLFRIVDKYQRDTEDKIFKRLVCQRVFGKLNKCKKLQSGSNESLQVIKIVDKVQNKRENFFEIVKKTLIQKQIQINNCNKTITLIDKDKKQQQQQQKQKQKQLKKSKQTSKQNKLINTKNKQSVFMVIDDDYDDNDEQLMCVQFEVIQKTQMKKMLIFQGDALKGLDTDGRVEIVQCDIVRMIQRINNLGCVSRNKGGQSNKKIDKLSLLSTSPRITKLNDHELNLQNLPPTSNQILQIIKQLIQIYEYNNQQSYYQTDEVKQFQTVLLKLIIQGLLQKNNNNIYNKDDKNDMVVGYNNLLQISLRLKVNENRINRLKLIQSGNYYQNKNSNKHNSKQHQSKTTTMNQINTLQQQVMNFYSYNQKINQQKQQSQLMQNNKQSPKKKKISIFGSSNNSKDNIDKNKNNNNNKQSIVSDQIIETYYQNGENNILLKKITNTLSQCVQSLITIVDQYKNIKISNNKNKMNQNRHKQLSSQMNLQLDQEQKRVFMSCVIVRILALMEIVEYVCYIQQSSKMDNVKSSNSSNSSKSPLNDNKSNKSPNNNKNNNNNISDNFTLLFLSTTTTVNQQLFNHNQQLTIHNNNNNNNNNKLLIPIDKSDINKITSIFKNHYQQLRSTSTTSSQSFKLLYERLLLTNSQCLNNQNNNPFKQKQTTKSESNLYAYQCSSLKVDNKSFNQLQKKQTIIVSKNNNNKKEEDNINSKTKQSKISSFIGSVFGRNNKKKSNQQNTINTNTNVNKLQQHQKQFEQSQETVQNIRKSSFSSSSSSAVSLQNIIQFQKASLDNDKNDIRLQKQTNKQIQLRTLLMLVYQMMGK